MTQQDKPRAQDQPRSKRDWREIIARISLPMLAGPASYGVQRFAGRFLPDEWAWLQAFSLEWTYIGLSLLQDLTEQQRKRAKRIAIAAAALSALYNALSGFWDRNPNILDTLPYNWRIVAEIVLAIVHGLPIPILAYLTADLLLHSVKRSNAQDVLADMLSVQRTQRIRQRLSVLGRRLSNWLFTPRTPKPRLTVVPRAPQPVPVPAPVPQPVPAQPTPMPAPVPQPAPAPVEPPIEEPTAETEAPEPDEPAEAEVEDEAADVTEPPILILSDAMTRRIVELRNTVPQHSWPAIANKLIAEGLVASITGEAVRKRYNKATTNGVTADVP